MPLLEAATEGARLRFRPVMMTSFAFILGLLPLVIAVGPSQLARRDVGTPVFGGMLMASFIGIFAIPALYVTFQSIRERLRPGAAEGGRAWSERSRCRGAIERRGSGRSWRDLPVRNHRKALHQPHDGFSDLSVVRRNMRFYLCGCGKRRSPLTQLKDADHDECLLFRCTAGRSHPRSMRASPKP